MIVYCQAISIAITITYPLFSAWSTAAAAMVSVPYLRHFWEHQRPGG